MEKDPLFDYIERTKSDREDNIMLIICVLLLCSAGVVYALGCINGVFK